MMSQLWLPLSPYSPPAKTHLLAGKRLKLLLWKNRSSPEKRLQILTFWIALPKTLAPLSHPQYPPGPISNASFSLKLFSILDVIFPDPEPTVAARKLSSPIYTVVTPVLPHSIYKMISVFRARTVPVISASSAGPPYLIGIRSSQKYQFDELLYLLHRRILHPENTTFCSSYLINGSFCTNF